jgi:NAD(P)H-hydrate epimerase
MKRLVSAREMRAMDARTIEGTGIPGLLLMEAASAAVAGTAADMLRSGRGTSVTVWCGRGNNGGDGMAAARHLVRKGIRVSVVLVGDPGTLQGDARINFRILRALDVPLSIVRGKAGFRNVPEGDLVVDALLGTGFSGPVRGLVADAIQWINRSGRPVLSVDLPSGLSADTGAEDGPCIQASRTVTFAEIKRGLVLYPGKELAGTVSVADIGIPERVATAVGVRTFLVEEQDVRSRLPRRPKDAYKGSFGRVLVLSGSTGMTGAAALCATSALRSGAGLVVLGIPESLNPIVEAACIETITKPLPQTESGSLSVGAESAVRPLLGWADAVAVGPGLSRHPETEELVRRIVAGCQKPLVLDADGINAFEGRPGLLMKRKGVLVMTPHPGELARLIGSSISDIEQDRIETARENAVRFKCVLVLKGAPTVTALPDGRAFINPTGNSGMATAGAGDVLTGLIAGLSAQGNTAPDAAVGAVYLHGSAGDIAASIRGERAMLAGDIADSLGRAFRTAEGAKS